MKVQLDDVCPFDASHFPKYVLSSSILTDTAILCSCQIEVLEATVCCAVPRGGRIHLFHSPTTLLLVIIWSPIPRLLVLHHRAFSQHG